MNRFHSMHIQLHVIKKTIESFGSEGTFKGHLVQPPCRGLGHLQLKQVAQSLIHDLEYFHLATSLSNLFLYFLTLIVKKLLSYVKL